ncbi:MAG: glycoside hydrolase family 3 N-terminal domain-containing protein [Caulobacteraceae bacterium]
MTRPSSRRRTPLALALCLSIAAGPLAAAAQPAGPPLYKDPRQPIPKRVEDLLSRMTLEEKVAQMTAVWEHKDLIQTPEGQFSLARAEAAFPNGIGEITRPSDRRGVKVPGAEAGAAGAAEVVGRGPKETADYTNAAQHWAVEHTRLGIPVMMHEEGLHGYVAPEATSFPQSIGLASTWDPDLLTRVFSVDAREMRARGAQIALAPVVDVARDPRWGRIEETYGEDPYLVGTLGLAAIRGFQGDTLPLAKDKVFATLKHFTGHGQPENGTNVGPAEISERTLRQFFFPPFQRAISTFPIQAVMPSYNEIDGVPSSANKWLLTDVLRGEFGFKGATTSDYFAIKELITRHHIAADFDGAALRAIDAGVDMELPDGEAYARLPALVRAGRVPVAKIDTAVRHILTMKFESGLFEHPYVDADAAAGLTATPDAIALARQAAREAMVLLKNDKGLLPLDPAKVGRLAVIGPNAKDSPIGGYSDTPRHVVGVLEAMQEEAKAQGGAGFTVSYAEGDRITEGHVWASDTVKLADPAENARRIAEAVEVAKKSDVVLLVLGDNEQTSREAWADNHLGDRDSLDLVGQQNDLAKAIFDLHKPTVVLLLNGRPLSVNLLAERADALIEGWYLGQETGHAVADVVFGRADPGGKLPVSIARSVGQLPVFYNYKPTARRGYLFDTTSPLYPFGYGLSYTRFDVSAPRLSSASVRADQPVKVQVDVANTGAREGDEVVQLYIHRPVASVTQPVLELKRFQRVSLKPGERRTVDFELTPSDFAFWNLQMKDVNEPGPVVISSGPSSVELKSADLTILPSGGN